MNYFEGVVSKIRYCAKKHSRIANLPGKKTRTHEIKTKFLLHSISEI